MKRLALSIALLSLITTPVAWAQDDPFAAELETFSQKASYALGQDFGNSLKQSGVTIDIKALVQGLNDRLAGKELQLTTEELQQVMTEFRKQAQANAATQRKAMAEKNLKEGAAFLAANTKKVGVKTTESGLQYKIIKRGMGASPKANNSVRVHYEGKLINGKVFDSSLKRGVPLEFPVNMVINGWTEALQLMKEGGEWELYIPSTLAYGPRGAGGAIGPNATLIFKVQLIKVLP